MQLCLLPSGFGLRNADLRGAPLIAIQASQVAPAGEEDLPCQRSQVTAGPNEPLGNHVRDACERSRAASTKQFEPHLICPADDSSGGQRSSSAGARHEHTQAFDLRQIRDRGQRCWLSSFAYTWQGIAMHTFKAAQAACGTPHAQHPGRA